MPYALAALLAQQPILKIVRGLLTSSQGRHVRDLAAQLNLSPAGVSDIIRRLKLAGTIYEERNGNRRCLHLRVSAEERKHLSELFSLCELDYVSRRSPRFSKNAAAKLAWMDEAYSFYRKVKAR